MKYVFVAYRLDDENQKALVASFEDRERCESFVKRMNDDEIAAICKYSYNYEEIPLIQG